MLFFHLFNASPIAMILIRSSDGVYVDVNPAAELLLGSSRAEMVGHVRGEFERAISAQDRDRISALLSAEGRVPAYPLRVTNRDGSVRDCLLYSEIIELEGQSHILSYLVDLTQQQRTTQALAQAEYKYRTLLDATPDAMIIVNLAGQIMVVNAQAERFFGYTQAELLGMSIEQLIPARFHQNHQTLRDTYFVDPPHQVLHATSNIYALRKDGSECPVEISLSYYTIGAEQVVISTVRDVSERKRAEVQLRESEANYRYLFEHNPHPMWAYDLETLQFLAVNDVAVAKYGYTRDEFLSMMIIDIRSPEDVSRLYADLAHIRQAIDHSTGWRHRCKDGSIIDVEISSHILTLSGRKAALVVAQDVTARIQAERALRESEARFATIFERSPVALALTRRSDYQLIEVNAAFLTLAGYTRQQAIGRTTVELGLWGRPQDRAQVLATLHANGQVSGYETLLHPLSGADRAVLLSGEMVEIAGELCQLIQILDITDRTRAEQALRELNQTLEQRVEQRTAEVHDLYERAPTGYYSLDADATILRINQTALDWLGYPREAMLGRPITDFLTPEAQAFFPQSFAAFKAYGLARNIDVQFIRSDGSILPTLVNATAIYDDAGCYVMSRTTIFDNSDLKRAENALRQVNAELARAARAKDEFLANMSHELRTPLNAILAFSEVLLEQIYGPLTARQQESIRAIDTSGRHLLELINDILDLSKVEAGRLDLEITTVSISEVCYASMQFVKEQALRKSLHLNIRLNDQLADMQVDAKRLKQMLVNLLSNAVKFTPASGTISLDVTVDSAEGIVHFAVRDSGIGIAPEDMSRLFLPFSQLDSALSRHHEGTGLGLALVRRLADL
ncbi:MAG: PAS domain S-box protein, partial [Oscillochloris sp.]|nr:PAS domain S-box protein [Oscillochloris sp.]